MKSQKNPYSFVSISAFMMVLALSFNTFAKNNNLIATLKDTVPNENKVYNQAEKAPDFPGGLSEFGNFLGKNIHYPAADRDAKVVGKVILQFIVERDGSVTDIRALRGPSKTEMDEAVRVMKLSPKWKPGIQGGRPVRVAYTVPINFTLNKEETPRSGKVKTQAPSQSLPKPATAITNGETVYSSVDKQPEFPGGLEEFGKFLGKNVRYPTAMREKMLEGKVFAQFIVEKDGSLSNIKVVKGPGYGSGEEAERVLSLSPKWSPGLSKGKPVRVAYTIPINFTLAKKEPVHGTLPSVEKSDRLGKTVEIRSFAPIGEQPLFIIDGITSDKVAFDNMDPNDIESFSVLKNPSKDIYGDKGKNGVILVTTRNIKKATETKK